jgi:hypothetical protein
VLDEACPNPLLAYLEMAFDDSHGLRAQRDAAILSCLGDVLVDAIHTRSGDT